MPQSPASWEYMEKLYSVPSVWLLHSFDFGEQSLIYFSPLPPELLSLSCTLSLCSLRAEPAPSLPCCWPSRGQSKGSRNRSVTPLTPDWAGSHHSCSKLQKHKVTMQRASIHNHGPGSRSAECVLQPDTPQTPLCPFSDIISKWHLMHCAGTLHHPQAAVGLSCSLGWLFGSLGLPTDYRTLKHPFLDGYRRYWIRLQKLE